MSEVRLAWNPKPRFNIAPTQSVPVILNESPDELTELYWGLVPFWAKDMKIGSSLINARAETVATKPAFRDAYKRRHCLVPADGFYEWKHEGKLKIPHRVVLKSREPFAFAGIWDKWKSPDGREVMSFSIITSESNDLMKTIHTRAPVILDAAHEETWLEPSVTDPQILLPLLKPFPADDFEIYQVSRYVSNSSNKGEDCIKPLKS